MGRLNAALNQLAERGVFALGPLPSEKVKDSQGEVQQQANEGAPEIATGQDPNEQIVDADLQQANEGAPEIATGHQDPTEQIVDADPQQANEGVPEIATGQDPAKQVMDADPEEAGALDTADASSADQPPASCQPAETENASGAVTDSTIGVVQNDDIPESVTAAEVAETVNTEDEASPSDSVLEPQQTEEEIDFKVPSHLFDTSTADMDELRAQLGVLTQAERESRGEDRQRKPVQGEILLPIVPQPLAAVVKEMPAAQVDDDEHQTGPQTCKLPTEHQAVEPPTDSVESTSETLPEARTNALETTDLRNDRFPSNFSDAQPAHAHPAVDADKPNESAYKPVLDTWFELPPQPFESPGFDGQADQSAQEQSVIRRSALGDELGTDEPEIKEQTSETQSEIATARTSDLQPFDVSRTTPTDFEIATAERLLQTDFGVRIQQLSEQISSQLSIGEPQVVLLFSMKPDGQRATAIAGLGMYVCAQQTLPTLLVDADIDDKRISRNFAKHGPGLMEVVGNQVNWKGVVRGSSCDKLHLLPTGTNVGMIRNLDQSRLTVLSELIDQWKQHYGLVIIDGGLTDSPLVPALTQYADATFLCVQLGVTNREELLATAQQLTRAGARLKGCITTGPDSK